MVVRFVALPVVRRARHSVFLCISRARSLARSLSFYACVCAFLCLFQRRDDARFGALAPPKEKRENFFPFFCVEKEEFLKTRNAKKTTIDRSIDRQARTLFSRYSWRAKKSTSSVFVVEQKSRSFFFVLFCVSRAQKRERNAERARISKNNFSRSAFPSLLEHAFTRGRERERERKTRAADPTRAFFQRKTRRRR